jgi:hypothetical protein
VALTFRPARRIPGIEARGNQMLPGIPARRLGVTMFPPIFFFRRPIDRIFRPGSSASSQASRAHIAKRNRWTQKRPDVRY